MTTFVWGHHCIFLIAIVACKYAILILRILWFGLCQSILIRMTYFSFYKVFNSEHYRVIVGYIPTLGQQVGATLWNITITVGFHSQNYRVTYYFVFMLEIFTSQKYRNILPSHYIIVPGASFWTAGWFEGIDDCYWWGWFIFRNQQVILCQSLIWYGTHPIHELKLALGLWFGHRYDHWPIIYSASVLEY